MPQYLLNVIQPDGPPPASPILEPIMRRRRRAQRGDAGRRRVGVRRRPAPAEHGDRRAATRRRGADDRRAVHRGQGAHRRLHDDRGARPRRRARAGAASWPRRSPLPIEVRPFVDHDECRRTIERVFRAEYGRAVAVLVRVFGDIDVAEEAVQDAFAAPSSAGRPTASRPSPAGWIITTARNRAIDRLRREATRDDRHAQAALLRARRAAGRRRRRVRCATTGCG